MYDTVFEFRKLAAVPPVGGAYKITCYALKRVYVGGMTLRAFLKTLRSVFVTAIKASVPVMVDRPVTYVIFVHKIHDAHDGLRIMGGVSVYLHIEDMSRTFVSVIRTFYLSLMLRSAMEIHRDMA